MNSRIHRDICIKTIIVFLICAEIAFAQTYTSPKSGKSINAFERRKIVKNIDSIKSGIDNKVKSKIALSKEVIDNADEKFNIKGFFDDSGLPYKLIVEFKSDYSLRLEYYYFDSGKLIFAERKDLYFSNDGMSHDQSDYTRKEEHRLYYWDNSLVKWIETIDTDLNSEEPDYKDTESDILESSKNYLKILTTHEN